MGFTSNIYSPGEGTVREPMTINVHVHVHVRQTLTDDPAQAGTTTGGSVMVSGPKCA